MNYRISYNRLESLKNSLCEEDEKLSSNNKIPKSGENLVIKGIPVLDELVFVPAIIQWNGLVANPFFDDESFKKVSYFLNKKSEKRQSKDKNTEILRFLFEQNPELFTETNLNLPLGKFAKKIKENYPNLMVKHKKKVMPTWKLLVNPNGGEDFYVSFVVDNITTQKGLYIWEINGKPEYIGIASGPKGLLNRINQEYGNITPYKCTLDGQSQTCRSNVSLKKSYENSDISLYIAPIDVESLKNNKNFIKLMEKMGFKGTRVDKNVLEVIEKYIIKLGDFKESGWNKRL